MAPVKGPTAGHGSERGRKAKVLGQAAGEEAAGGLRAGLNLWWGIRGLFGPRMRLLRVSYMIHAQGSVAPVKGS